MRGFCSSPSVIAISVLASFILGCGSGSTGPAGPPGPQGDAGAQGVQGPQGPAGSLGDAGIPVQIGTINGTVTSVATGQPLGNVTISGGPGNVADAGDDLSGSTSAAGTFSLTKVPVGAYSLTFSLPGYKPVTMTVGVTAGNTTALAVSLATDTSSTDGITLTVTSNLNAGYGQPVTLTATGAVGSDPNSGSLKYSWTQTAGAVGCKQVGSSLSCDTSALPGVGGIDTNALTFTTLTLQQAKLDGNLTQTLAQDSTAYANSWGGDGGLYVPARFGAMGISEGETGSYGFTVTATDAAGHSVSASATVWATSPTSGLRNVPTGVPVWFEGDSYNFADGGLYSAWSWTLTAPTGSSATLSSTSSQFVTFTPDVKGTYKIAEATGGESASVYVADYDGLVGLAGQPGTGNDYQTQGCTGCHSGSTTLPFLGFDTAGASPDMFSANTIYPVAPGGWATTTMADSFEVRLDTLAPEFGQACIQCHTLGSNAAKTVANGGFDDTQKADNWTFPTSPSPSNYSNLETAHPDLAQKTSIQCENCHGPSGLGQVGIMTGTDSQSAHSFKPEVCTQCHDDLPFQPEGSQWKQSLHANLSVAVAEYGVAGGTDCSRCHTAQGYAEYAQELLLGCTGKGENGCVLTGDGNPPAANGSNTADAGTLVNLGLTTALVEPQTCTACHDPHVVNTPSSASSNPDQLRVFDHFPPGVQLMNGVQANGVGAGLTCMVCHNSRPTNGEIDSQTIVANGLTATSSIPTTHNATQTDVFYGVNAFFMPPGGMPSPHLAVKDTCVGCHHDIPNAAQAALGQSKNHEFVTDSTICSTCHGGSSGLVDGDGLMGGVKSQMAAFDSAIFTAVSTVLSGTGASGYNTTFRDISQSTPSAAAAAYYLCNAATGSVYWPMPATAVPQTYAAYVIPSLSKGAGQHVSPWRNLTNVEVTFAAGVFPAGTAECTAPASGKTTGTVVTGVTYDGSSPLYMSITGIQAGPTHLSTGAPLFNALTITAQSIYNEQLLNNDLSNGIHNLPFYSAVIENTEAKLATVTPTNP